MQKIKFNKQFPVTSELIEFISPDFQFINKNNSFTNLKPTNLTADLELIVSTLGDLFSETYTIYNTKTNKVLFKSISNMITNKQFNTITNKINRFNYIENLDIEFTEIYNFNTDTYQRICKNKKYKNINIKEPMGYGDYYCFSALDKLKNAMIQRVTK